MDTIACFPTAGVGMRRGGPEGTRVRSPPRRRETGLVETVGYTVAGLGESRSRTWPAPGPGDGGPVSQALCTRSDGCQHVAALGSSPGPPTPRPAPCSLMTGTQGSRARGWEQKTVTLHGRPFSMASPTGRSLEYPKSHFFFWCKRLREGTG